MAVDTIIVQGDTFHVIFKKSLIKQQNKTVILYF